jgi:hypothetical protein
MFYCRFTLFTFLCFLFFVCTGKSTFAQQQRILHPVADAVLLSHHPNNNYKHDIAIACGVMTTNGVPYTARTLIQFDLSVIPRNATILSVELRFYGFQHEIYGRPNAFRLSRLRSVWQEQRVSWSMQPLPLSGAAVVQHPGVSSTKENVVLQSPALLQHVKDMVRDPRSNFGWIVQLDDERNPYAMLRFAAREHDDLQKLPVLVVQYQ